MRTKTSVPDTYRAGIAWITMAQQAKPRAAESRPAHTGSFCECGNPKPANSRHGGCERCTELDSMGKVDESMRDEVLLALGELQSATIAEIADHIGRPPWQTMSVVTRLLHAGDVGKEKPSAGRFRYHLAHG